MSDGSFSPEGVFAALQRHSVDYVTIGGVAANAHGSRRVTLGVDVTPEPSDANYRRLAAALDELDIVNGTPGAPPYEDLRSRAVEVEVRGVRIPMASLDDLIAMKRATARPQDLHDISELTGGAGE